MKTTAVRVAKHRVSLFAVVGVINTLTDIVLLNILRVATHTTTEETGKLIVLNIFSASSVAMLSFYLNRKYVFKSHDTHNRMFLPFLAVTLSSIFILQSLVIGFTLKAFEPLARMCMEIVRDLHIPIMQNFSLNFYEANLAKLCATAASMIWNYVWYKRVIFNRPPKDS
ncbi:MAG: GtrA family protein [bacterium]|nr:GtrA family protein [bacterium]